MQAFLVFFAGLGILIVAAEMVVRGTLRLALALGVTPFLLGLTVVAVGTSMPELAVGITAGRENAGGIAVGNIAGTNMVNILLILGLSALLRPLALHRQVTRIDLPVIVLSSLLMAALAWDGLLSPRDGVLMCGSALLYTALLFRVNRVHNATHVSGQEEEYQKVKPRRVDAVLMVGGIALSVLGANWLVDGAVDIARQFGVPDAVIGLTIVAIGTSSPELVTTIISTLRDERDVAVGNLIGSSVYNILVILGVTCLVTPQGLPVARELLTFDIPLMLALAFLCIPVFISGRRVSRTEGALFVALYIGYLAWLLVFRI